MGLEDSALVRKYIDMGDKKAGSTTMGIVVGVCAGFGGILFGYDTGTISGILAMKYVTDRFPKNKQDFSSSEKSLIVSILSVGTFFGALSAPFFSDSIGRRWTLILSSLIVFNLGIILQTVATGIPLLCVGRVFAGLGVGLVSAVIPLYQSEASPKWIRGAIVASYQLCVTIGIFLAACVNQGTHKRNDSGSYRIPIAVQFLWSLILGGLMIWLPETPRFFVRKGDEVAAKESLSRLRRLPVDHPELIEEYDDIKAAFDFEAQFGKSSWAQLLTTKNQQFKRLMTGVWLQAFQQLTGVNFVFYFGTTFFNAAGVNGFTVALATNIVNVGMTFPGIVLMEIAGRRKLLLWGATGMAVSQLIVAITGVATKSEASKKILVAFTCTSIASFAATWGPACWVIVGEIFPLRTRAKSAAISTASNWLWNWGIAYATPYLVDSGKGNANLGTKVFFIWGGFNVICGLFAYFFVYETANLSLEQIDEMYERVDKAWNSPSFVPSEHAFRDHQSGVASLSSATKQEHSEVEEVSV